MFIDFHNFLNELRKEAVEEDFKDYCNLFGAEILYLLYGEGWAKDTIREYLFKKYKNDLKFHVGGQFQEFLDTFGTYLHSISKSYPECNAVRTKLKIQKKQKMKYYASFIQKAREDGKLKF